MKKRFFIFITVLCSAQNALFCGKKRAEKPVAEKQVNLPPQSITVFVHGVRLPHFLQRMPIFHNSFYCPQGLSLAKDLDRKYTLSNVQELYKTDPEQFSSETLYLFGWQGKSSYKARYEASQRLYEALLELQKKHPGLPITIISQSHGGNVVLNLARVVEERNDTTLSIERFIICSSPVQAATAQYVHSPLFKHIYSFYSPTDFLQVIDPQGLHRDKARGSSVKPTAFSQRRFPDDPKLFQCRVRLNSWHMGHSSFIYKPFLRQLPAILRKLETPEGRATLSRVRGCTPDDFMIRITSK